MVASAHPTRVDTSQRGNPGFVRMMTHGCCIPDWQGQTLWETLQSILVLDWFSDFARSRTYN